MAASTLNNNIKLLAGICLVMTAVHVVNLFFNGFLLNFGIYPRSVQNLLFIFTAPFLHGSWAHLFNNLIGFAVFGTLCILRGRGFFIRGSLFIIFVTGLLVWIFGRPAMHIGASGWVFGLWSLCIAIAWFQRSFVNILIAIIVIVFYGGMLYGVLPGEKTVSYEAHLFGAISGVLYAWLGSSKRGKLK